MSERQHPVLGDLCVHVERSGTHASDRPVRPRGRCSRPLKGSCACFRVRAHDGPCQCHCEQYPGSIHGAVAVPASVAGVLVTDAPWGFNPPLRREEVRVR